MNNIFESINEFSTSRLKLKLIALRDAEAMFLFCSCGEVTKDLLFNAHQNIEETKQIINIFLGKYNNNEGIVYSIFKDEKMIGSISVKITSFINKEVIIGYAINKDYWNNGYGSEALKGLIKKLFEDTCIQNIKLAHSKDNIASKKVILKNDFRFDHEEQVQRKKDKRIIELYSYKLNKKHYLNKQGE